MLSCESNKGLMYYSVSGCVIQVLLTASNVPCNLDVTAACVFDSDQSRRRMTGMVTATKLLAPPT